MRETPEPGSHKRGSTVERHWCVGARRAVAPQTSNQATLCGKQPCGNHPYHTSNDVKGCGTSHGQQRFSSDAAATTIRRDEQTHRCQDEEPAVNGPPGLASHEAPGNDVDPLKEPDASGEKKQDCEYVEEDAHQ
jgi:hypothetical protein